jgi:hypothetical protein
MAYPTFISDILGIAATVEKQSGPKFGGSDPLDFSKIVNEDGEPGTGILRTSRIVRD